MKISGRKQCLSLGHARYLLCCRLSGEEKNQTGKWEARVLL